MRQRRIEDHENRHKVKPGVYVRLAKDGTYYCKVRGCMERPASEEPIHRGLCVKHFEKTGDGRLRCTQCTKRWCVAPEIDGLCEFCHPAHQDATPHEAQVLEAMRRGESPVLALQQSAGLTPTGARKELSRMRKRAGTARRMHKAMKRNGLDLDSIMRKVSENVNATKRTFNRDGDLVDESPDYRASNQALDMALKAGGHYPGKDRPESKNAEQTPQTAVVIIPAQAPIERDRPIYSLPIKETVADDPEDV